MNQIIIQLKPIVVFKSDNLSKLLQSRLVFQFFFSNFKGFTFKIYLNIKVGIGIITNLIVLPPSLLLVQLFRRIKRRHSRISAIKSILKLNNLNKNATNTKIKTNTNKIEKIREIKFPWWFKIFAYMLSFAFAFVSLFFVIIKGIEFGDEKVQKWLTSLLTSFFSSIFLTQPIQVIFLE